MGAKMNLRIITKNYEADAEIEFLTNSISKPYGRATAIPPALELQIKNLSFKVSRQSCFESVLIRTFKTSLRSIFRVGLNFICLKNYFS